MHATPRHGRIALAAFAVSAVVVVLLAIAANPSEPTGEPVTATLSAAPGGSAHPTITVDPATNLVDHQIVTVHGEGFDPRAGVSIYQCTPGDPADCTSDFSEIENDGSFTRSVGVSAARCSDHPETCLEIGTFDQDVLVEERIGTVPLSFDPEAPLQPDPTIAVDTPSDMVDGDVVTIEVANLRPGDSIVATVCAGRRPFPQRRCTSPTGGGSYEAAPDGTTLVPFVTSALMADMSGQAFDCRQVTCTLSVTTADDDTFERATSAQLDFDPDAPAHASTSPSASARLVEARTLEVQGEGFVPTEEVYATTCIKRDGPKQCLFPATVHATAGEDGTVAISYEPEPFDGFTGVEDCRGAQCFVLVWGSALGGEDRGSVRAPFAGDP